MKKQYILTLIILLGLIIFFFYFKNEKVRVLEEYSSSGKLIGTNEYVIKSVSYTHLYYICVTVVDYEEVKPRT